MKIYKSTNLQITNSKGFSVVELLIYMALLTIFLLVLLDIFVTTLNFKLQNEASSALDQDARSILASLNYNIYNAASATVPLTSKLSLDSGAKIYELVSGDLLLNSVKLNGGDTKINSVVFTKIAQTIQVSFTLESLITTSGGPKTETVSSTLGLRY